MTEPRLLPAGTIVTTHGVRGEVKLRPVTDSAEFLLSLSVFYMDSKPVKPSKMRVHKGMLQWVQQDEVWLVPSF